MLRRTLNLGILAHVDAGKTTLTERLLYSAGVIDEVGSVDKGTTRTDSLALEQQRGITIKSAVVSFPIDDVTVNLIDTPGHPDFIAEVERVLNVLDGCVLVLSAVEGVQPQTRILMRALQRLEVPTLLFVNKIDRVGADPERVLDEIEQRLTPDVVPMGSADGLGTRAASFASFGAADGDLAERAQGGNAASGLLRLGAHRCRRGGGEGRDRAAAARRARRRRRTALGPRLQDRARAGRRPDRLHAALLGSRDDPRPFRRRQGDRDPGLCGRRRRATGRRASGRDREALGPRGDPDRRLARRAARRCRAPLRAADVRVGRRARRSRGRPRGCASRSGSSPSRTR